MITINKLNIQYGDKHLFRDISAQITPRDRIGLVGVNGAGKSTLLQIIAGTTETDFGVVTKAKKATIGYLPQEIGSFPPGRTLYKEAETAFDHVINMQKELENINRKLAATAPDSPQFSALLEQQGELQHQLDQSDVFRIQSKIEKVLAGLGFRENDFDRDCQSFSGGWIMRLMLAKHLLAQPDFLLLDEPTNHL
ncbi:MAG: ABC-F family ATP-binding cassette domain-containing protein, partial [Desulfobulbaceae bacterium]|nr:ABC-F family ATP-binding cassette domain-containing protein [Desulfobulbaceae bacterium]